MSESTSIRLKTETVQRLKNVKVHPRETYDDVIQRLLKERGVE